MIKQFRSRSAEIETELGIVHAEQKCGCHSLSPDSRDTADGDVASLCDLRQFSA
jgi:hypothetical protein